MNLSKTIRTIIFASFAASMLASCAAPTFNMEISRPEVSDLKYEKKSSESHSFSVLDKRAKESKFSEGTLNFNILIDGKNINEVEELKTALAKELVSRGSNIKFTSDVQENLKLDVIDFKMFNHRTNGFTPLITLTQFAGDLWVNGEKQRIVSFVKRAKVPIWFITEDGIVENTYNQPVSLVVQDLATRITQRLDNNKASDQALKALVEEINNDKTDDTVRYFKVYQLGFSNNKSAIPYIISYLDHKDDYVRLAAISSLGLLDAESEVDRLKKIFTSAKLWQDRAMSLKALADINTPEADAIVDAEWERVSKIAKPNKEAKWNRSILSLYR
ncbi:MAG: HEAT repeat domain-containing protein [Alteromonadales bacterium]|nr:HEAT repeat domain-containing protein [Alteromonadales bacterium]